MEIRMKQIKALGPCRPGWIWFLSQPAETDLEKLVYRINKKNNAWAYWLLSSLMNKDDKKEMAMFIIDEVVKAFQITGSNSIKEILMIGNRNYFYLKTGIRENLKYNFALDAVCYSVKVLDGYNNSYFSIYSSFLYFAEYIQLEELNPSEKIIKKSLEILKKRC